jgi:NAD(P)H-dependent flavin oxidoreductase YrpB (nitropropane dioxygenase family)
MEISDPIVMTVAGAIGTTLTGTIAKLYIDNKDLRNELGQVRDKYQEKLENFIKELTGLIITSTAQTNTFSNSITTITSNMAAFQDKVLNSISSMRDEFMRGKEK